MKSARTNLKVRSGKLSTGRNWKSYMQGDVLIIQSGKRIPYANIQQHGGIISFKKRSSIKIKPADYVGKITYNINKSKRLKAEFKKL